jgi:amidase
VLSLGQPTLTTALAVCPAPRLCREVLVRSVRSVIGLLSLLSSASPSIASAQAFDIVEADITSVQRAITSNRLTCRALVQHYLDRIAAYDRVGPTLHAIQHVNVRALQEADSLDALPRSQPRGPLHCVPVLVKDQVNTRDMPTSYGSVLFRDFVPQRDATIVERLEAAGAIILAKASMGEFAGRYVSSASGIIRNAYDPTRNPSGSSSGTGAGIAANFGLVGIGEDTGGSIRGPAAVHALVGLRPTLGLVSVHGMLPANPTQDVLGPMTRTVEDAARVLDVIAGYDAKDPITAHAVGRMPTSYRTALRPDALRGRRVGVLRTRRDSTSELRNARRDTTLSRDSIRVLEARVRERHAEYAKAAPVFDAALDSLRVLGVTVIDSVVIPPVSGRRVGNSFETEPSTNAFLAEQPNAPVRTWQEILLSGTVNPWRARAMMEYVGKTMDDADYLAVLRYREAQRTAVLQLMADQRLDALVYATYDAAPTRIADDVLTNPRPDDGYGLGDNRGLSPSTGFPAITVPAGFTSDGLPIGLELLGRAWSDDQLLAFAYAFEQRTRHRRPPTTTPPLPARR